MGPPIVLFIGYRVSFSEVKKFTVHLHIEPKLRMGGAIPAAPHPPLYNHSLHTDLIYIVVVAVCQQETLETIYIKIMDCLREQ
jgi:hypothetical protein